MGHGLHCKIRELSEIHELKMSAVKDKCSEIIKNDQAKSEHWKEYFEELFNLADEMVVEKLPVPV